MSERTLKIGVMGCASIAERMVIPAIQLSTRCELAVVASRTPEKARAYGEKFGCDYVTGYQALLDRDDIDAIYMPLPTGLHLEWGMKALAAGKHILFEKSLAANYADAVDIVQKAKEMKLLVQENFMFAYHRQFALIKEWLNTKRLGTIRCVRSAFGFPPFPDSHNIRYQKSLAGGSLLDAGAYTLKVATLLLGKDLEVAGASLSIDKDKNVDVAGGVFMVDKAGTIVETAFGFDHFYQCTLEIWGTKGKLTAERIFTAGPSVRPTIKIELLGSVETMEIEEDNHFLNLLDDFSYTTKSGSYEEAYDAITEQARLLQSVMEAAKIAYV